MSTRYVVQQGDFVSRIAADHGFGDFRAIWDHPDNARLRAERGSPNVLLPGDVVVIPERIPRHVQVATGQSHRFELRRTPLKLSLRFLGLDRKPIAGTRLDLVIDGESRERATNAQGRIEEPLPANARTGAIHFRDPDVPFDHHLTIEIRVGDLDPVEAESGQRGRLNALGYDAGDPAASGDGDPLFRSAVEEFQCDNGLMVDGVVGPVTRAKLKDVYGC